MYHIKLFYIIYIVLNITIIISIFSVMQSRLFQEEFILIEKICHRSYTPLPRSSIIRYCILR